MEMQSVSATSTRWPLPPSQEDLKQLVYQLREYIWRFEGGREAKGTCLRSQGHTARFSPL